MLCEHCKKRESTVHLTEITDGVVQEVNLCEKCAEEKGVTIKPFSVSDFLSALATAHSAGKGEPAAEKVCPACGISFAEFQGSGRLGCPEDYTAFREQILPLIERIHDATQHTGKAPACPGGADAIECQRRQIQADLRGAVEHEEYERAAELRDALKELDTLGESDADAPADEAGEANEQKKAGESHDPE